MMDYKDGVLMEVVFKFATTGRAAKNFGTFLFSRLFSTMAESFHTTHQLKADVLGDVVVRDELEAMRSGGV